jgi:hypothetical protein
MLFRVKLTLGEYLGYNWKLMTESKGLRNLILGLLFIASLLPVFTEGKHVHGSEKLLLFLISFCSISTMAGFVFLSSGLTFYYSRPLYNTENVFIFSGEGIAVERPSSKQQLYWSDITLAAELSTCFYFRSNSVKEGFFIPKTGITPAEHAWLIDLLKEKMEAGKVRLRH